MIRAVLAWYLINLTWDTQPLYFAVNGIFATRVHKGTNPLVSLRDGVLLALLAVTFLVVPIVGIFTTLLTSPWFVLVKKQDYQSVRDMIEQGRMNWWQGRIKEKPNG